MRRARSLPRTDLRPWVVRFYHERAFDLHKLWQIIQLVPDRKKSESETTYISRCYN